MNGKRIFVPVMYSDAVSIDPVSLNSIVHAAWLFIWENRKL